MGGRSCRHGRSGAASPAAPSPCPDLHLPRRDPRLEPRRRGRIRGAAAAAAPSLREAAAAASSSPSCKDRAGAARTGAPRWCRCPGQGGDAAAGDSGSLFGSVRKVTAATRPTLNPPPHRTQGRGKEEEEGRRRGCGLGAVHYPAQNQVTASSLGLSLRDAGLGAPAQLQLPQTPGWGRAPLPSPWILAFTHGTTGPASKRGNFPVSCGADAHFWLIRSVMVGLASRYLFNHLLFGGRGNLSPEILGFVYVFGLFPLAD